jgi:hypothetical protein
MVSLSLFTSLYSSLSLSSSLAPFQGATFEFLLFQFQTNSTACPANLRYLWFEAGFAFWLSLSLSASLCVYLSLLLFHLLTSLSFPRVFFPLSLSPSFASIHFTRYSLFSPPLSHSHPTTSLWALMHLPLLLPTLTRFSPPHRAHGSIATHFSLSLSLAYLYTSVSLPMFYISLSLSLLFSPV